MSTKLPIKLITLFEKCKKYTLLFPVLICLLTIDIWKILSMVHNDRKIKIFSSSAKFLCKILSFF